MLGEPAVKEIGVTLQQPEAQCVFSRGSVPGSGGLHRLLGGEVWIVTCACTQACWWLQQQP